MSRATRPRAVGLAPVKTRIREIAAFLLVSKARRSSASIPRRRRCTCASPAIPAPARRPLRLRMAEILHRLGYLRKGHLVTVTRDDLVGQYIGHTAPKTKRRAQARDGRRAVHRRGVLPPPPENERDYGQEAIEILLQVDGEPARRSGRDPRRLQGSRMETFFSSQPGMSSRIAHHIDFPDYDRAELLAIAADAWPGKCTTASTSDASTRCASTSRVRMRQPQFRQRALDPQRARPRAPAPGESPGRAIGRKACRCGAERLSRSSLPIRSRVSAASSTQPATE